MDCDVLTGTCADGLGNVRESDGIDFDPSLASRWASAF